MFKRLFILAAVLPAAALFAREPTTRPKPIPPTPVPLVGSAIDPAKPAFVPKFAQVHPQYDSHFAERDWAYRFGIPGPAFCGYGGYGYFGGYGFAGYGFGGGSWGGTQVQFR